MHTYKNDGGLELEIEHDSGDTLDNRRPNLRPRLAAADDKPLEDGMERLDHVVATRAISEVPPPEWQKWIDETPDRDLIHNYHFIQGYETALERVEAGNPLWTVAAVDKVRWMLTREILQRGLCDEGLNSLRNCDRLR